MTMSCTLRLDLVILLAGFRPYLQLEAGPAEQIPHSVGWAADSAKQAGSCVLVPCRAIDLGAARLQQQQQSLTSSSSSRQAAALCKVEGEPAGGAT